MLIQMMMLVLANTKQSLRRHIVVPAKTVVHAKIHSGPCEDKIPQAGSILAMVQVGSQLTEPGSPVYGSVRGLPGGSTK